VAPVRAGDPDVHALIDALTDELAGSGYTPEQTFGYSVERLEQSGVHLVGAHRSGELAGIAGVEVQGGGFAELKRFYVLPTHRGTGVVDVLLDALATLPPESVTCRGLVEITSPTSEPRARIGNVPSAVKARA